MEYIKSFIDDANVRIALLEEGGFQQEPAKAVLEKLGQLCAIGVVVEQLTQNHTPGDSLPLRFEVSLDIPPMKISGTKTIDVMQIFEDANLIVPLSGNSYRVMLSSLMNTLFSLSTEGESGSVRHEIRRINHPDPFLQALDTAELEIIGQIHDSIDMKYLDVVSVEQTLTPSLLLDATKAAVEALAKSGVDSAKGLVDLASKRRPDKTIIENLVAYVKSIMMLSTAISQEASRQWEIMQAVATYPRSFLARKTEPLFRSGRSSVEGFRNHPLMVKFEELVRKNHIILSNLGKTYRNHIESVTQDIPRLPKSHEMLVALTKHSEDLPDEESFAAAWVAIDTHSQALLVQAQLVQSVVASMDTLIVQQPE